MNFELDLNLVVLCGRLAADPELRVFDSGTRMIRYLMVVRSDEPHRRVDVLPVTQWDPPEEVWEQPGERADRIWVCGSAQRRHWEESDGRRSRVEIVASQLTRSVTVPG